jgi:hypothetical protein
MFVFILRSDPHHHQQIKVLLCTYSLDIWIMLTVVIARIHPGLLIFHSLIPVYKIPLLDGGPVPTPLKWRQQVIHPSDRTPADASLQSTTA